MVGATNGGNSRSSNRDPRRLARDGPPRGLARTALGRVHRQAGKRRSARRARTVRCAVGLGSRPALLLPRPLFWVPTCGAAIYSTRVGCERRRARYACPVREVIETLEVLSAEYGVPKGFLTHPRCRSENVLYVRLRNTSSNRPIETPLDQSLRCTAAKRVVSMRDRLRGTAAIPVGGKRRCVPRAPVLGISRARRWRMPTAAPPHC
jgi:hypothetical protein